MTHRILIADDEHTIADTLAAIVTLHGFEARTAYNGQQAVKAALEWRPHILLSDVLMPVMDGIEAAAAVCEALPECRVILLSGLTSVSDLVGELRQRGRAFEVLRKPIPPEELLALLQRENGAGEAA